MLGLGAEMGLHGAGLFMVNLFLAIAAKTPIRHLADFKGKKILNLRFPVSKRGIRSAGRDTGGDELGDVPPALQQGAIDGAVASTAVFTAFHYQDAAK